MDSLILGGLVYTAKIVPKVWVSTSSKQDLHHTGRNQTDISVTTGKVQEVKTVILRHV